MSTEDWRIVSKNLYNYPVFIDVVKEKLWHLAKSKREGFVKNLKEKNFSLA